MLSNLRGLVADDVEYRALHFERICSFWEKAAKLKTPCKMGSYPSDLHEMGVGHSELICI
jgi:hypothetical protein